MLLGIFIGYENYFVDGQKEYLIDREFRALNRLSAQLNAEFDRARLSVISLAKNMAKEKVLHFDLNQECLGTEEEGICAEARRYSKIYLEEIWDGKNPSVSFLVCLGNNTETVRLEQEKDSAQLRVLVQCPPGEEPPSVVAKKHAKPESFLRMDMKVWVRRAFQEYKNSFDDLLIADESGLVLFQQSESGPRIANLRPILAKGTDISAKQNVFGFLSGGTPEPAPAKPADSKPPDGSPNASAGRDASGLNKKLAPEKLERLLYGSSANRVAIGGKDYLLFAQPSPVALGSGFEEGSHWGLVLVGLRLVSSVDAESHALPYSVLIWVALCAVVLLGVSWPWFKLQYMSVTERFRPRDGILLLFTLLLAMAGVMLMLLNTSYLLRSTERTDHALTKLAEKIQTNFDLEISRAFRQLQEVQSTEQFGAVSKDAQKPGLKGNYPIETYSQQSYPYFEIAFWADCDGQQLAKLDIRKVATPAVNLSQFTFFRVVKSEMEWAGLRKQNACQLLSQNQDSSKYMFFQPLMSPNTNEFGPVLASPFIPKAETKGAEKIAVQVLVFRPMSVVDSVLPPGYGFAVINEKCDTLFHSDAFRDLRENFCEESRNRTELSPWLVSGVDTSLNITYGGKGERAYLTKFSLPGLSADQATYLIVFQEGGQQLTLNLAVILVSSIFLVFYFAFLGIGAAGYLTLRGLFNWNYAPRIVWPCREFAMEYLQVFCLSLLLGLLYLVFYRNLHEAPLIGLTLGAAFLSIFFAVIRLSSPNALFGSGIAISSAALLTWFLIAYNRHYLTANTSSSATGLAEWSKLPYLPVAVGLFSLVVCPQAKSFTSRINLQPKLWESLQNLMRRQSNLLYALATVSLMVCVSVIPCAGFFKYAYDAVSELSLKHDEAFFSERLLARKNRLANYYKSFGAHEVAKRRLEEKLDRYDKIVEKVNGQDTAIFFTTDNEPSIDAQPANNPCSPGKMNQVDFGLNDWIEKQSARATLTFPSNELGSEISRLGVAETDECKSWERFWLEPTATKFSLRWKDNSRAPRFTVTGQYPEWQGLMNWARGWLLLFLAVLVIWLLNLAKKIFLTNVERATALEIVQWRDVKDIKRDSLVIGLPRSGKSAQLRKLAGLDPRDFRDLRDLRSGNKLCELQDPDCYSGAIIIDQFDFNMRDHEWNQKRLDLIENLLNKPDQKLVLVSTVDPLYFLAEEWRTVLCAGKDSEKAELVLDRWARALDKFSRVKVPNTVEDDFANEADKFLQQGGQLAVFARWICEECSYTPMLQRVGVELLKKFQKSPLPTREQLVEMVVDRTDAYYRMLWAGLTASERLALYQLALDGWANPKNAPAIHQLEQKQLIYRQPMYRIMNDSFRRFIRSSEHEKEIAEFQKQEQQSTWQVLRFVVFAALIGTGMWLLYAQAQLFQIGIGYVTAIATLVTAIAGISARARGSSSRPPADLAA